MGEKDISFAGVNQPIPKDGERSREGTQLPGRIGQQDQQPIVRNDIKTSASNLQEISRE